MNPLENQTVTLADGRILGYAEYGLADGFPVLYFHGYPSSRLEARPMERIAHRRGLRILALDRPGYGLSTFQPGRRIVDWPQDVKEFAEKAGLKQFAVLGWSGGGPYAVACAYGLPRSMLSAAGAMAGSAPWRAGVQGFPKTMRLIRLAVTYIPGVFKVVSGAIVGMLKWAATSRLGTRVVDRSLKSRGNGTEDEQDDESMRPAPEQRERLFGLLFEGWAQGTGAFVQEGQLLTSQDWGFEFEDVAYDQLQLWHGTKDTRVPLEKIRYLTERLPHCTLKEYDGTGHADIVRHLEEILAELVPEGKFTERSTTLQMASTAV